MADSPKKLSIPIETPADLTGLKQTAKALKETQAAAGETGTGFDKLSEKTDEATKHTEKHEISHRALHKIMEEIGKNTAPELGHALAGSLYGPIGLFLILGSVVEFAKKAIEEQIKAVEDLRHAQSELETAAFDAQAEAANNAAKSAADYAAALKRIQDNTDSLKQAEELRFAVINAQIEAERKLLEAKEKVALVEAGGDQFKQAIISQQYGDRQSKDELAAAQTRINAENESLIELQRKRDAALAESNRAHQASQNALAPGDETAADAVAQKKVDHAKAKEGELDDAFKKATGATDLKTAQENIAKQRAIVAADKDKPSFDYNGINAVPTSAFHDREKLASMEKAEKEFEENRKAITENAAIVQAHTAKMDALNKAAAEALSAYEKLKNTADSLAAKISQDEAVHFINRKSAAAVAETESPDTPIGHGLLSEKDNAYKILTGRTGEVPQAEQEFISTLGAMIAGHSVTLQQAAQLISKADATRENLVAAITQYERTSEQMKTTSEASIAAAKRVEQKLADHERQLNLLSNRSNTPPPR